MNIRSIAFTAALIAFAVNGQTVEARETVKIGALRCAVSGALGLVVAAQKTMECKFTSVDDRVEYYYGTVTKFGLEIGATNGGMIAWDVFAPTAGDKQKALAGNYAGVDASAALGLGVGANVLVGGSDRSFMLQPLSVELEGGVALAAGVEMLELNAAQQ